MASVDGGRRKESARYFICEPCNIQFSSKYELEYHKGNQNHASHNGKTPSSKVTTKTSGIYVRGHPKTTKENDLIKYFSQFGNVIWAHFGHDFLLLDFTEPAAVEKVMARRAHFLNGRRLTVRHKEARNNIVPINDEEVNEKMFQNVTSELSKLDDLEKECFCLARCLQPDPREFFKKYNQICEDLYTFLSGRFPNIQVNPFGSTLTGLGFNNSDVDVFLSNVKQSEDDEITCLNVIKRLLAKSKRFGNTFVIPGAKIPIIKCVHFATKIRCDINIKNMLGVCNSKLIRYYLSLDVRVKQAVLVLKYWAKVHKITGQNHLLTNYSLTLMFIFFLQQEPYNFPAVFSLQQPEYNQFCNSQDNWNGGFVPNRHFDNTTIHSTPLLNILEHFFNFYEEFSYKTHVICPYLGRSLPKTAFKTPTELPDCYAHYKEYILKETNGPLKTDNCICVQDPFEHCRNATGGITDSVLEKFLLYCRLAKKICAEKRNVMYKLLTEDPPNLKKLKCNYKDDLLELSLHKSSNVKYLQGLSGGTSAQKLEDDLWFDSVVKFVTMALKDFLQLSITNESDDISPSKNFKNEGQSDVHDTRRLSLVCAGKINMWQARKATAKQLNLNNANSTMIERETAITNRLKEMYKNLQDATNILSFKICLENKKCGEVFIRVQKVAAYKKSFKSFAMFLVANIPVWFEMYERDLNKTFTDAKKE